jgi:hypothetical protein
VQLLRDLGWRIVHLGDLYPDDAGDVADEDWLAMAAEKGLAVLTQDERIRYRAAERGAVADGSLVVFCLTNGNRRIAEKVDCFHRQQSAIYRVVRSGETAIYGVYDDRVQRKWPEH